MKKICIKTEQRRSRPARTYLPVLGALLALALALVTGTATNARAAWNVTIGATSTNGSWSGGNPDVWTPSGSGATVAAAEIESRLSAGTSAQIVTSGGGTEAGDITVNEAVSWSENTLTLTAAGNVNINSLLTASGTSALVITNLGLTVSGRVDFPGRSGTGFLTIDGTGYTVINSLGAEGSTTGTDLQGMNGNISGHYALGADIDASATGGWNSGAGFAPVGTSAGQFTGNFDGLGHTIDGLFINRPTTNYQGLFGWNSGTMLRNIVLANVDITGSTYVGGLASVAYGSVTNVHVSGSVIGSDAVGGLIGSSVGSVSNCYAAAAVRETGGGYGGGLVGVLNGGTLNNCYAAGPVSGFSVGGLVGYGNGGSVSNSYATGWVSGTGNVGGLVGRNLASVSNCYWDKDTTGQAGGLGYNSGTVTNLVSLTTGSAFTQANYGYFDFTNTWWMVDGSTRPMLRSEWSTVVKNGHQLQMMAMDLSAHYLLGNDIALSGVLSNTSGAGGTSSALWGSEGFAPVGNGATQFTGTFDGQGHTIDGLFINRPTTAYVGLLGRSLGTLIRNVGLTNVNIKGTNYVGGLTGNNDGTVSNSYATGSVGGGMYVGGLVGENYSGTVSNSYATGSVTGGVYVGGLVGWNENTVSNSYATGSVTGSVYVGGLVGQNNGTVSNCYWDKDTTGQTSGISVNGGTATNVTGMTTSAMQSLASFGTWTNIDDAGGTGKTWRIYDGHTYPLLRSFLTPLTATADDGSKTYDGNPYSGGNGITLSDPSAISSLSGIGNFTGSSQGAIDAGSYVITPDCWSDQQGYDIVFSSGTLTIDKANSTTSVTGSPNPSNFGDMVTFTATVSGIGATGTVDFISAGTTTLCSAVTLTIGQATCSTSALYAGDRTITATYSGDGNYNSSSGTTLQTVSTTGYLLSVAKTGTGTGTVTADIIGQEGNGINCGTDCQETYAQGATITLTPTADTGSVFSGWSGDCDESGQVTIGAADAACTATFAIAQHTITTSVSAGSGTISCSPNPVDYGLSSSCTVAPANGYAVQSVIGCGGSLSGNIYTTGAITADCTVTAAFVQTSQSISAIDAGLPGIERADGGDDGGNLVGGNPSGDLEYRFLVTVTDSGTPQYVRVHMTQRSNPLSSEFYAYDMACTGDFAAGATCTYDTKLGPAAVHTYYFEIKQSDGTVATYPATGYLTGPVVELLNGYTMVGTPRDLTAVSLDGTAAFGSATTYRWISQGVTTDRNYGDYVLVDTASPVDPGEGYFVKRETSPILPELGEYGDITETSYGISLVSGWNIISNPYGGNVKLADIQVQKGTDAPVSWSEAAANGWLVNAIYDYKGSDWGSTYGFESAGGSPDAALVPWIGYWIYLGASDDTYTLIVPKP